MGWMHVIIIIVSTLGGVFVFCRIMRERLLRVEEFRREDMQNRQRDMKSHQEDMQNRQRDMKSHREDMKWERLFERLSLQDKKHNS